MSSNFRAITLKKIANNSSININKALVKEAEGPLTNLVERQLEPSSVKEKLSKLPSGKERDDYIVDIVTKKGIKDLVPVTVPGPSGTKITYYTMPDYIMVDGVRLTMSANAAQRIANELGMILPTSKMDKQIYEAADTKVRPAPLSSAGVTIDGRHYTGQDVVNKLIADPRAALAYNDMINEELSGKNPNLVAGHMKTITQPSENDADHLYAGGWQGQHGDALQDYIRTFHPSKDYSEYSTSARLVSDKVIVQLPNGKQIKTTMDKVMNHPDLYKSVSDTKGTKNYKLD